jgi:hypothetical protein
MDKFPEAFRRFKSQVDIRGLNRKPDGFKQLEIMVKQWSPSKWHPTRKQLNALAREADKEGFRNVLTGDIDTYEKIKSKSGRIYRRKVNVSDYHGLRVHTATQRKTRTISRKQVKVMIIHNYVKRGYSANKISRELKRQGRGMRRKELLKIVREAQNKQLKADSKKYTRKKYRKK